MKTMLTELKCYSLKMVSSNDKQTTMADGEVEEKEKGKKERNWKHEERGSYSLLCMTVAGCSS